MSDSKTCRNVFPCQQIKNCLSSLYQTLSTAVFATTLFVIKIKCCCVTNDATSSKLLNSTNEANTFLTMYNIIRFSRLSKLVPSNLKTLATFFKTRAMIMKSSMLIWLTFNYLLLLMKSAARCYLHIENRVVCGIVVHNKKAVPPIAQQGH